MISKTTSGVIEMIYRASVEPEVWEQVATEIAGIVHGSSTIFIHDRISSDVQVLSRHQMEMAAIEKYRAHFATSNPIVPRALEKPQGTAQPIEGLIRRDEFDRHEYYNDWFRPLDFHYCTGVLLSVDERTTIFLTFFRPKSDGNYSTAAQRDMEALAPHLRRSVTIGRRLDGLNAGAEAGRLAFQALGTAAFSLTRAGVVLDLNPAAEELVRSDRVLRIAFGRLASVVEQRPPLLRQIEEVIDSRQARTVSLARRDQPTPLEAMLIPRVAQGFLGGEPSVMMILKAPQVLTERSLSHVGDAYGLTPAERRLLQALAGGETVAAYCERQGVSRNTVKTQLSSLFGKTGAAQQSDLVRLVYSSAPLA